MGSVVVYAGLLGILVAFVSLLHPPRFLRVQSRAKAAVVLGISVLVLLGGIYAPAGESRVFAATSALDEFAPVYQFNEVHHLRVAARRDAVFAAIKAVGPEEIFLFRALTAVPRLGRRTPESIVNAPAKRSILDTATHTGFLLLEERPGREILIGVIMPMVRKKRTPGPRTAQEFKEFTVPGIAKIAMNFSVEDAADGVCEVTTETRIYATDSLARRRFAGYWRIIYPGSSLIRLMWLRAIRSRAETLRLVPPNQVHDQV